MKEKKKLKSKKTAKKKGTERVKGQRVDIEVELNLSDAEKVKRGELALTKIKERDKLITERKEVSDKYKGQINALDSEVTKLLVQFDTQKERTRVNALEVKNFTKNIVEYHFKGKIVHTRELRFDERQETLPIKGVDSKPAATGTKAPAQQELAPPSGQPAPKPAEDKACVATPPKRNRRDLPPMNTRPVDRDIQSVIREETGKNTSYSALNGVR